MSSMREKVYQYTHQRLLNGNPPTIREVQKAVGLKAAESARAHLEALVEEGRLVKRSTRSRSYALPPDQQSSGGRIPILGQVQAGALTTAVQDIEGYVESKYAKSDHPFFALKVRGLSMRDAGILPNDLVIVRQQAAALPGDIVVALVEDDATVKRLKFASNRVILQAENPDFADIEVRPEELNLLGKVVEVRRYYEPLGSAGL